MHGFRKIPEQIGYQWFNTHCSSLFMYPHFFVIIILTSSFALFLYDYNRMDVSSPGGSSIESSKWPGKYLQYHNQHSIPENNNYSVPVAIPRWLHGAPSFDWSKQTTCISSSVGHSEEDPSSIYLRQGNEPMHHSL